MSFFKVITSPPPLKPQVCDTDFKKCYPSINANMSWCTLEPYVTQSEELFIIPSICRTFYQVLCDEYQSTGGIADSEKARVFKLLKTALAFYTLFHAYPHINIREADAGLTETVTQNTQPVRQWVYNQSRWALCKNAYQFLDLALMAMDEYIQEGNTNFDAYKNADCYCQSKELFLPNAQIFSKYFFINNSRKAYVMFRPYIERAEKLYLKPLLCEFYDELKEQLCDDTLSTENEKLIDCLRQFLMSKTIITATPEINLIQDGAGWKVYERDDSMNFKTEARNNQIQHLITKHESEAELFCGMLLDILHRNIDDYPTFRDSDCNQNSTQDTSNADCGCDHDDDMEAGAVCI